MSCYLECSGIARLKLCVFVSAAMDYVGGVPYEILQPVLERCTPTQLYHLEDCNPVSRFASVSSE